MYFLHKKSSMRTTTKCHARRARLFVMNIKTKLLIACKSRQSCNHDLCGSYCQGFSRARASAVQYLLITKVCWAGHIVLSASSYGGVRGRTFCSTLANWKGWKMLAVWVANSLACQVHLVFFFNCGWIRREDIGRLLPAM